MISWACSIADVEDLVVAQQQSLRVKEHVNAVVTGAGVFDLLMYAFGRKTISDSCFSLCVSVP